MNIDEKKALELYIKKFRESIFLNFQDNIDNQVLSSLSNMLALHYISSDINSLEKKIYESINKIKKFLQDRIIISYDFSSVLSLFAIAISTSDSNEDILSKNILKSQNKDAIIVQILSELDSDEVTEELKLFLKSILNDDKYLDIINYISANKQKTKELMTILLKNNISNNYNIYPEMIKVLNLEANKLRKVEEIKSTFVQLSSILTGAGIVFSICTGAAGLIASASIIPATIFGMKITSKYIDNLASSVTNSIYNASGKNIFINKKLDEINQSNNKEKEVYNDKVIFAGKQREINHEYLEEARKILGNVSLDDVKKISKPKTPEVKSKVQSMMKFINK